MERTAALHLGGMAPGACQSAAPKSAVRVAGLFALCRGRGRRPALLPGACVYLWADVPGTRQAGGNGLKANVRSGRAIRRRDAGGTGGLSLVPPARRWRIGWPPGTAALLVVLGGWKTA